MHTKIITPDSYDFGVATQQLIKFASGRLRGEDERVLVKRAGSEFVHLAKQIELLPGEIPIHSIAMGATEAYGPNRNGDGFKEAALRAYVKTFEKYAKRYRHHKNKVPSNSYGIVKLAYYNPVMKRVELLQVLNGTKEAAERNNGHIADREIEKLERGEDIPESMACKVAYDVCSSCGNKAPSRKQYCKSADEGGSCDRFGCYTGLTKVSSDGHVQHVDNPHPHFFDISSVFRNADRIAFGAGADYMHKAASDGHVMGGSEIAELLGVSTPLNVAIDGIMDTYVVNHIKLAYALAALEDQLEDRNTPYWFGLSRAVDPSLQPAMDIAPLGSVGSQKMAKGLAALAGQKIAMPVGDFVRMHVGDSTKSAAIADQVAGALPGVYNRMIAGDNLEQEIASNPFKPSRELASASQRQWAEKYASTHSLGRRYVDLRCQLSAIRNMSSPVVDQHAAKRAAASSEVEYLARRYALYKLAFLSTQTDDMPLTSQLIICQNYSS